ncbi:MAG: DUF4012 domain-containing protein [Actinomycetota bacterium]|nr:DUF4012 domain-containing protein [Actinomycetota bacterium]
MKFLSHRSFTDTASGALTRRNTLTRDDLLPMAAVCAVAALGAALAGCHPTGNPVGDALCAGVLAAFTTWMAATASWWALTLAGAVTAVAGGGAWPALLFGLAAAGIGLWIGDRRASLPAVRCASAALTVQGLVRLPMQQFFGASALVAAVVTTFLIAVGLQRRRRRARRRIVTGVLVFAGVGLLAAVGFALSAVGSRGDIETGYRGLVDGLEQLEEGEPALAAATLHRTATALASASDGIDAAWVQPARLVPVVAQHQQALAELTSRAAVSAEAAADALDVVDFDALTIQGGRIDVDAVALLEGPLDRLQRAVGELRDALQRADSPWLVAPVAERLDEYRGRADDAARQAGNAHAAAVAGPALLGSDGPRSYFIGFASPAEARGLIGLMGNYAVITIDGGVIERTAFGRINDLGNQLALSPFTLQASDEFHARYGPYGAGRSDTEAASRSFWSNVTMSPDMPSVGPLVAQLWVSSGGEPVDGVIILDPAALAGLLEATGPVVVPGLEQPLSADNVEQFLLLDQYALDTPERRDLLEDVAAATLDAVLGGSLPGPRELASALSPAATGGHLLMWVERPDEQEFMHVVGIDGALPPLAGRDGVVVVNNNATANKIDSFLRRTVQYDASFDATSGTVTGTATITLTNTAPSSGYPDYVIGSEFLDLPLGTNRTLLSIYTPLEQVGTELDGETVGLSRSTELGWHVFSLQLDLAPGETRTLVVQLRGVITSPDYELVLRPQPLAIDERVAITVVGDADVRFNDALTRRVVVSTTGATALR